MILDQKKLSVETDHILLKDSNNGKVSKKRRRAPSKRKKKARRKDFHNGRWSEEEKLLFLVGLRKYGKGKWKEMASVLTSRSSVQIKSHGQKLLGKMNDGTDILAPLYAYERRFGTILGSTNVVSSSETESDDDTLVDKSSDLAADESLEEDDVLADNLVADKPALLVSLPTAASLCDLFSPIDPAMTVAPPTKPLECPRSPLLLRHFGTPNPISFVSSADEDDDHKPVERVAFGHGGDVRAAMLLCQLSSKDAASRDALPALSSLTSIGSSGVTLQQLIQPIPASSVETEQDHEALLACAPIILLWQDDSNTVTPTTIAEV